MKKFLFVCCVIFLLLSNTYTASAKERLYRGKNMPGPDTLVYNIKKFDRKNHEQLVILGLQDWSVAGMYKIYYCWKGGCDDDMYLVKLNSDIWIIRDNLAPTLMSGGGWRTVAEQVDK